VSVCGTGVPALPRGFSCRSGLTRIGSASRRRLPIPPPAWPGRICRSRRATGLDVCSQKDARASPPGPPVGDDGAPRYGTINPLSIAYAQTSLGLGPTNPERNDLAQEPLGMRCVRFSRTLRYSCRHSHFRPLQPASRRTFVAERNAPLPITSRGDPAASAAGLAPFHCRRRTTRPVSCYALFQGWLLLSQPPGCHSGPTAFRTEHGLGDLSGWSGLLPSRRPTLAPAVSLRGRAGGIRSLPSVGRL
jgi:hypothetical protein